MTDFDFSHAAAQAEEWKRRQLLEAWQGVVPARFAEATLADLADQPPALRNAVTEWATAPQGRNLVLLGPVGTGKTHAMAAACRARHLAGDSVLFTPVVELLDDLRPGGCGHSMARATATDVLALDDLAAERDTDWTAERLYALVNRRWMEKRPTVVTTNLDPDALAAAVGERMFSRLVGSEAVVARLAGADRRRRRG